MRIIKKPYKLTPLNREIEKINRMIWIAENKNEKFPLSGFNSLIALKSYYIGLNKAKELVKTPINYK